MNSHQHNEDLHAHCIIEKTIVESQVIAYREEQKSDFKQTLLILVLLSFDYQPIDSQTGTNHRASPEKYG